MTTIVLQDIIASHPLPENVIVFSADGDWRGRLDAIEADLTGPAIVHASLAVAQWIQKSRPDSKLNRGTVLPQGLEAHNQMGRLGSLMLNDTGVFLPFSHLEKSWADLQTLYGPDLFLRPNSPYKPFAGRPMPAKDWAFELNSLKQIERVDATELCFVGPHKSFTQPEWRFWMVDSTISSYAPYSFDGPTTGDVDEAMKTLAREAADRLIDIDMLMVVDCVHTPEGPKVMEANGFSTSGLYKGVDLKKIWAEAAPILGF